MLKFDWRNSLILAAILVSCGKPLPALENFDEQVWKEDKNGCNNKRISYSESILHQKSKLQALDEMDIVNVLGKPDRNELYKRNQKFYYYFLEPSEQCPGSATAKKLVVRFNAMGLAKEITVE